MQRIPHLIGRAVRETGQALDRLGLTIAGNEIFKDTVSRHRPVMNLFDKVTPARRGGRCRLLGPHLLTFIPHTPPSENRIPQWPRTALWPRQRP